MFTTSYILSLIKIISDANFERLSLLNNVFGIIHLHLLKFFRKTDISYPLIRTLTFTYQGARNKFLGKFWVRTKWIIRYQTNREMETIFRPRFSIQCFANWPFRSFCLSHELLAAKLYAYGLETLAVCKIKLSKHRKTTK